MAGGAAVDDLDNGATWGEGLGTPTNVAVGGDFVAGIFPARAACGWALRGELWACRAVGEAGGLEAIAMGRRQQEFDAATAMLEGCTYHRELPSGFAG